MTTPDLIVPPPVPRPRYRKFLSWAVLAAIFALIFMRVPLEEVLRSALQVRLVPFTAITGLFVAALIPLDAAILYYLVGRLHRPLPFRAIFYARGAASLWQSLTTMAGHFGMGVWLARNAKIPPAKAASTILLVVLLETYALLVPPTALLLVLPGRGPALLLQHSRDGVILVSLAAAWLALGLAILFWKKSGPNFFQRLADRVGLWSSFHRASARDYAVLLAGKTLLIAVTCVFFVILLPSTRIHITAVDVFLYFPLVSLLASIPITPARLGTTQVGFLIFFPGANPSDLIAFSLLWQMISNIFRWIFGALFLRLSMQGSEETSSPETPAIP